MSCASALGKTRLRELEEGAGAVRQAAAVRRQAVLLLARHLAEGAGLAVRQEQRIVAEAQGAARRPDHGAVHGRLELLDMAVGPGDAQRRDEMPAPALGALGAALDQQALNLVHRETKILVRPGPARRVDAGLTVERIDREPGIVGEGRHVRRLRRGLAP